MGGSAKPPKESDESKRIAKKNEELSDIQLEKAKQPPEMPKIEAPKPLPPPPPPAMETGEAATKAEEARRAAMRRTNTVRKTIFAGEANPQALGGSRTLLG